MGWGSCTDSHVQYRKEYQRFKLHEGHRHCGKFKWNMINALLNVSYYILSVIVDNPRRIIYRWSKDRRLVFLKPVHNSQCKAPQSTCTPPKIPSNKDARIERDGFVRWVNAPEGLGFRYCICDHHFKAHNNDVVPIVFLDQPASFYPEHIQRHYYDVKQMIEEYDQEMLEYRIRKAKGRTETEKVVPPLGSLHKGQGANSRILPKDAPRASSSASHETQDTKAKDRTVSAKEKRRK